MRHFECVEIADIQPGCRECGAPLPAQRKRGQRPEFCSDGCRSTADNRGKRDRYARAKALNEGLDQAGLIREFRCHACGRIFKAEAKHRRCCSDECKSAYQSLKAKQEAEKRAEANPKKALTCAHCQRQFHPSRASAAQKAAGYIQQCCSVKCRVDRERGLRPVISKTIPQATCKVCSVSFAGGGHQRYCSDKCREIGTRRAKSTYSCVSCGSSFSYVKTGGRPQATCSDECAEKVRKTHRKRLKARREARKRGVETESFTHLEIFRRDGWRCGLCHKKVDPKLAYPDPMSASLDHIVPLAECGAHTRQNVQCAHWICNTRKRDGAGGQMRLFG